MITANNLYLYYKFIYIRVYQEIAQEYMNIYL